MQSPATRRRYDHVLAVALRYLTAGFRLIPNHNIYLGRCTCRLKEACTHTGKHPRIAGWSDGTNGQASNDPQVVQEWIARWPWLNLGLATGQGLLALDIDPAHSGLLWLETHQPLLPATAQQITGSGGIHLLYLVPGEYYIKTTGPTSNPIAEGVDTRGDGGQIIVAPSQNRQGPYQWVPTHAPWERPITKAPPDLLGLLLEKGILVLQSNTIPADNLVVRNPVVPSARPDARLLVEKYRQQAMLGTRNSCGFHLALQLRDNGYSKTEAAAYMRQYQQMVDDPSTPYTEEEALRSLDSAYQRPPRRAWDPRRDCQIPAPPVPVGEL